MKFVRTIGSIVILSGICSIILHTLNLFVPYLASGIFLIAGITTLALVKLHDVKYKIYTALLLFFLAIAAYFFGIKTVTNTAWLNGLSLGILGSHILLLTLSLRRNFHTHSLSLLRQHPWISAIVMAGGYFLFQSLNLKAGYKQVVAIALISMALIATMFVIERFQKVKTRSFYFLLACAISMLLLHNIYLKITFNRVPDYMEIVALVLSTVTAFTSIFAALNFEKSKSKNS